MRKAIEYAAIFLAVFVLQIAAQNEIARAQDLGPPEVCNTFPMNDVTSYGGAVYHTPMILLSCQNGVFMDYGDQSGPASGRRFLAAAFDEATAGLQGNIIDYEDGTGCGPVSYAAGGAIIDGQFVDINGFRPVRNSIDHSNACLLTGDFEEINRSYELVEQSAPAPAQNSDPYAGSSSSGGGQGSNCGGINAGTLVGGALGGLAGSQIGSGSGNTAAIAGGVAIGALLGSQAGCR